MNNIKKIALLALLLLSALPSFAGSKPKPSDFRKGISSHQDWIERFKENHDYRIFKMLACRGGATIDNAKAKEMSNWLKEHPERFEYTLKQWRIISDPIAREATAIEEWRVQYGNEALIFPPRGKMRDKARYLTLATKTDRRHAERIAYYMERVHKLYQSKFKTKERIEGKFIIKLFPNYSDYRATKGPSFAFAYFRGSTRELVGYVPRDKNWPKSYTVDALISTFFHEGFHQFLHYYVPDPPTWIDEGFAEMFETIQVKGSRLIEGKLINNYDLKTIQHHLKSDHYTPLKDLIYYDQRQYYANVKLHYPQGWSLTHFLAKGSPSYRKFFTKVLDNLKNGMDRHEAIDDVFAKVDWQKMEVVWKSYVKKLRPVKTKNKYKF